MKTWKKNAFYGIAALLVLALTLTACSTVKKYRIPKDQRQSYSETVEIDGISEKDLLTKVYLFFTGFDQNLQDLRPGQGGIYLRSDVSSRWVRSAVDAAMCHIHVSVTAGQYTITLEPFDTYLAEGKNVFFDMLSKRDTVWTALTTNLRQAVLTELSPYEVNALLEVGYTEYEKRQYARAQQYFIKAALAEPNNEEALIALGNCYLERGYAVTPGNVNLYWIARHIYRLVPPSNQIAQENIRICDQLRLESYRIEAAQRQQYQEQRRQQMIAGLYAASNNLLQITASMDQSQGGYVAGTDVDGITASSDNSSSRISDKPCSDCGGSGDCSMCNGTGKTNSQSYYTGGGTLEYNCAVCKGRKTCGTCRGTGRI